jgi:hypothetical protein
MIDCPCVQYGHRPVYCSNDPRSNSWWADCYVVGVALRNILEPLVSIAAVVIP